MFAYSPRMPSPGRLRSSAVRAVMATAVHGFRWCRCWSGEDVVEGVGGENAEGPGLDLGRVRGMDGLDGLGS